MNQEGMRDIEADRERESEWLKEEIESDGETGHDYHFNTYQYMRI